MARIALIIGLRTVTKGSDGEYIGDLPFRLETYDSAYEWALHCSYTACSKASAYRKARKELRNTAWSTDRRGKWRLISE